MVTYRRFRLALTAGAAALALTALPTAFDSSSGFDHAAWAGNGNGKDNGHGNGNANGHGAVASNGHGKGQGSSASSLGALNAAHASETALANASPNSRVGKIATYKEAELASQQAAADAAAADQDVADAKAELDAALAANADADPLNDVDQATIDGLEQDLADAEAAAAEADAAAEAAQDEADAALVDASNKDITDDDGNVFSDVRDAVNDLLGI